MPCKYICSVPPNSEEEKPITFSVLYIHCACRSDGWPVNSQDKRWKNVDAGRNEIEIPELYPNQKYVVKVLAKYANADNTIENWSEKEVTAETGMCNIATSFV